MPTAPDQSYLWNSDRDLSLSQVRVMAKECIPGLTSYNIEYIGSGWCNDVYSLNDEWILRFPRRRDVLSALEKEDALSSSLIHLLKTSSVTIADITTVKPSTESGFPYPFGVYPMIKGVSAGMGIRPATDWDTFTTTLGRFLSTVHSISAGQLANLDVPRQRILGSLEWLEFREYICEYLDSLDERDLSNHGNWLQNAQFPEPFAGDLRFIHNDLSPEHILIDPADGVITGVIDWEDAAFGDPVSDFVTLPFWIGWQKTRLVIEAYDLRIDERFFDRLHFAARLLSLGWLYDESRRNDDVSLQKGYVRQVFGSI